MNYISAEVAAIDDAEIAAEQTENLDTDLTLQSSYADEGHKSVVVLHSHMDQLHTNQSDNDETSHASIPADNEQA